MTTPYYTDERAVLHHGDCLDVWPLVSAVELYQLPRQPGEAEHAFRYRLHQFELSAIDYLRPTENIAGVSV